MAGRTPSSNGRHPSGSAPTVIPDSVPPPSGSAAVRPDVPATNRAGRRARPVTLSEANNAINTPDGAKVWGRSGAEYFLGRNDDVRVTICIYRVQGIAAFEEWLQAHYPPRLMAPDVTVGQSIVDACVAARQFDPLVEVLRWAVMEHDAVTRDLVLDSEVEKLIAILNAFWEQSGLRYLEQMVKANASAVWAATLEALSRAAPMLGEGNARRILAALGLELGSSSPAAP